MHYIHLQPIQYTLGNLANIFVLEIVKLSQVVRCNVKYGDRIKVAIRELDGLIKTILDLEYECGD